VYSDVIIIGSGIVGASCARELANAGLRVSVLDAGFPNATGAGMGHIVAMDDNPAEFVLCRESARIWREWAATMDSPCAYAPVGTLWVAADAAELDAAEEKGRRLKANGIGCELLTSGAMAKEEPALRGGLAGGLLVNSDSVVYAPGVVRWLMRDAGPPIHATLAEVTSIDGETVTTSDGRQFSAQAIVVAAGLQAVQLCPDLPIRPKKGHLAITDRYPGTVKHQMIELGYVTNAHLSSGSSVAFNVQPRPTGQLLIGSSRQFDTTSPEVEPNMVARMLDHAIGYMPGLGAMNVVRTWTGFRATTPDNLPIIGKHPAQSKTWLAVGHEGLGVTTAPATARLLRAQMLGEPRPFDERAYELQRFSQAAALAPENVEH
jgi:glycine/D-amino acid oxidase-like deaminating enzyme